MSPAEKATGLLWASDHLVSVVRWGLEGDQSQLSREEMAVILDLVAKQLAQALQALQRTEVARAA
jgi:hypothetical protein